MTVGLCVTGGSEQQTPGLQSAGQLHTAREPPRLMASVPVTAREMPAWQ